MVFSTDIRIADRLNRAATGPRLLRSTYLTIDTMADSIGSFVSYSVVSGEREIEVKLTVTGAASVLPMTVSGHNGGVPVSWSGQMDLAAIPAALAQVPGWPSNAFEAQVAEASYFGPACRALVTSQPAAPATPAMATARWEGLGRFFAKALIAAGAAGLGLAVGAATVATGGVDLLVVGAVSAIAADAEMITDLIDQAQQDADQFGPGDLVTPDPDPDPDPGDDDGDDGCFAAGTIVSLGDGEHHVIEQLAVGDLVASRDESSEQSGVRRVARTWVHHDKHTIDLILETGERVRTTSSHRIFTIERGILAVSDLHVGDHVKTLSGVPQKIADIVQGPDGMTVHNLTVDGFHTYFVGAAGVWVHNDKSTSPDDPPPDGPGGDLIQIMIQSQRDLDTEPERHPGVRRRDGNPRCGTLMFFVGCRRRPTSQHAPGVGTSWSDPRCAKGCGERLALFTTAGWSVALGS